MKQIKFKNTYSFAAKINLVNGPFSFETLPLANEINQARENGAKVLGAALEIEHKLEAIIQKYLFGSSYGSEGAFFNNEILRTSYLDFAKKKQILLSLTINLGLSNGVYYSELERLLKKVMLYRDAFAHGEFIGSHNENIVLLHYFSGEPKEDKLTDEYWDKLVIMFAETEDAIKKVEEEFDRKYPTK